MKSYAAIKSMHLRTLPLSAAGVVLGILLAVADFQVGWLSAVLVVLTAVSLQILSNLSHEAGENKVLIGIFIGLSTLLGALMVYVSWGTLLDIGKPAAQMDWTPTLVLLLLAAVIGAATKSRALGYLYAFVSFGLLPLMGAYLVCTHTVFWRLLLPGAAVGFFSLCVLNPGMERIYHTVLIVLGWVCMIAYCLLRWHSWWHYLFVLTLPLFVIYLIGVWKRRDKDSLLVISTFLFCLLAGFGFIVNLL